MKQYEERFCNLAVQVSMGVPHMAGTHIPAALAEKYGLKAGMTTFAGHVIVKTTDKEV